MADLTASIAASEEDVLRGEIRRKEAAVAQGRNPDNHFQRRVFFHLRAANESGEKRHPQEAMRELAAMYNFGILAAVPQSLFDGWDFWIEESANMPTLPSYLLKVPWKSVGEI
jgi:hypothetical protein